jgi:hypothetical protein
MTPLVLTDKPFPEPEWFKEAKASEARALANEGFIHRLVRHALWDVVIVLTSLARSMRPKDPLMSAKPKI